MAYTVRDWAFQMYRLINASNPVIPLHGDDEKLAILVLNQLLQSYASTGLMLTIAKTYTCPANIGTTEIVIGPADYMPTPDITAGRLANHDSSWLLLDGVTYPLIQKSRDDYLAAWKYDPLKGLPRFVIIFPDTEVVRIRLYPAPSEFFEYNIRGKFQMDVLTKDSDLSSLPQYYIRYLLFAGAKDVAMYKGRAAAWTPQLEDMYREAQDIMVSSSEVNLSIAGDEQSLLNGAWRVRAGI